MKSKHYELKSAKVNFILHWLKEGASQDVKIILPELYFEAIGHK
jgi:ATP-dependent DNA helicase RecQ